MKRAVHRLAAVATRPAATALLVMGCGGENPLTAGLEEPIRVTGAQFVEGALPGGSEGAEAPRPTSVTLGSRIVPQGASQLRVTGFATPDAYSVGVRLTNHGSGYWALPVSAPDPANDGQLGFSFYLDVAPDAPPGLRTLQLAAVDGAGQAGSHTTTQLCITPRVPDNLNACDKTLAPPALVVSLAWDRDVDLDLRVVTPGGAVVDAKRPTAEGGGRLDIDSTRECTPDGRRRENLVWQEKPARGVYQVYANLHSACGFEAARFTLTLHSRAVGEDPGTYQVVESRRLSGSVLAHHENGGAARGTFVTEFTVR